MLRYLFLLAIVSSTAAAAPVFPGGGNPSFPKAERAIRGADGRSVAWVEGRLGHLPVVDEASVIGLVSRLAPYLGLDRARDDVVLESLKTDEIGMRHARFLRVHEGLPVVESDFVLHFAADGTLASINGRYPATLPLPPLRLSVDKARLEQRALTEARILLRARNEAGTGPAKTSSRLVVWPSPARYVLEVDVEFEPHQKWRFFIDAVRGTRLASRALVQHDSLATGSGVDSFGRSRTLELTYLSNQNAYTLIDQTNGANGGAVATLNSNYSESVSGSLFLNSTKTFSDKAAVDVHANLRIIYDYFKNTHGRTSWDDKGADVIALVHYGRQYANAFWNGELMAFGDGDGSTFKGLHRCLDVATHELSHAVISGTVGLAYENQSGALNEHFADVFAVIVDDKDWTLGEDCVGPYFRNGFLRSLSDPPAGNQPGHMSQYQDLPNTEAGDHGGVHVNSGIVNKAAYLVGTQLGRATLGRIWYRILDQRYLNARSQFLDMRRAAIRACKDLYPSSQSTCDTVASAFDSVGIVEAGSGGGACPPNSSEHGGACYCDDGYRPNSAGNGCEPERNLGCPPNSSQIGDACYCDDGFVVNAQGTGCERAGSSCPANSHRSGGVCVCDDGYQGTPSQGHGCTPVVSDCPPNSRPSESDPNRCACIDGWVVNEDRTACVPGSDGCGNETYYGRCVSGSLVYCDGNAIKVLDCVGNGYLCGLQSAEVGNNCLKPKTDPCDGLNLQGECAGNVSRWCQDNAIHEVDCGDVECVYLDAQYGYACNPCPANSIYHDGSCYCSQGYEPDAEGEACVKSQTGEPDGPDDLDPQEPNPGESKDSGSGERANDTESDRARRRSGCATDGGSAGGLALFLAVFWLGRRRWRMAAALVVATSVACSKSAPEVIPDEPQTLTTRAAAGQDVFDVEEGTRWTSPDGTLRLTVAAVVPSSLCPEGARCVWAGLPAHVVVQATADGSTRTLKLFKNEPANIGAWRLVALSVTPPSARLSVGVGEAGESPAAKR